MGILTKVREKLRSGDEGGVATKLREKLPGGEDTGAATEPTEFTCECGATYRFTGEGRHRVYWKADASKDDPVLDGQCVECGKPLPGHHPREDADEGDAEQASRAASD